MNQLPIFILIAGISILGIFFSFRFFKKILNKKLIHFEERLENPVEREKIENEFRKSQEKSRKISKVLLPIFILLGFLMIALGIIGFYLLLENIKKAEKFQILENLKYIIGVPFMTIYGFQLVIENIKSIINIWKENRPTTGSS